MTDCCDTPIKKTQKSSRGGGSLLPWLILGISTLIAVGAGFLIAGKTGAADLTPTSSAKAYVAEDSYAWGDIDIKGGNASHQFTVENRGSEDLKLTNIRTSCACTTAQVTINGQKSPYFSMHSTSSWVGSVPAGGQAVVEVVFDPLFHGPDALGPIERVISIETNASENQVLELKLTGNVVEK